MPPALGQLCAEERSMAQYTCKMCGQPFESQQQLEQHNREKHPGMSSAGSSGMQGSAAQRWLAVGDGPRGRLDACPSAPLQILSQILS